MFNIFVLCRGVVSEYMMLVGKKWQSSHRCSNHLIYNHFLFLNYYTDRNLCIDGWLVYCLLHSPPFLQNCDDRIIIWSNIFKSRWLTKGLASFHFCFSWKTIRKNQNKLKIINVEFSQTILARIYSIKSYRNFIWIFD